jgi:hypothetical protein
MRADKSVIPAMSVLVMRKTVPTNEYKPDRVSHPGETLEGMLVEREMDTLALSNMTGISELSLMGFVFRETLLSGDDYAKLEKAGFGLRSFWVKRTKNYEVSRERRS